MKNLTFSLLLTTILLAITARAGQNFGSEVCKTTSCYGVTLIAASCNYTLDIAQEITAAEAYCTCHNSNFTSAIESCLECMEPYNIATYKESTWERLCPNLLEDDDDDDDDDNDSDDQQSNASPRSMDGQILSTTGALIIIAGMVFSGTAL
ncbi:hypothetical protein DFP73DRAFT_601091 [Morchella snyderi]|nr:hypothetical protein DFP73DRAFT_601091 [Morchella snyderi]